MALVDSLMSAIVRADGDALVMHVGERPYVVVGTQTINISTHGLNLESMTGMLTQLLPDDAQTQLEEFGAVEYRIPPQGDDRFSVVAARGGDDIWIEIRRRRQPAAIAKLKPASEPEAQAQGAVADAPTPFETPVEIPPAVTNEPAAEPIPEQVAGTASEPVAEQISEPIEAVPAESTPEPIPVPVAEAAPEAAPVVAHEMPVAPAAAPELAATPQGHVEAASYGYDWMAAATTGHVDDAVTEAPAIAEAAGEAQAVAALEQALGPQTETVAALITEQPGRERPLEQPVAERVAEEPVLPEPIAEPATAPPIEEQPASVEEPVVAALAEPVLEAIDEEVEVVAVAETTSSTFAEATVDRSSYAEGLTEAAVQQPAAESQPRIAASIETPRIEAPQVELPRVDVPPLPPTTGPGEALPFMRTVRIEVPPRTVPARATSAVDRLLRIAHARGATALFLTSESRPWMRLEGELRYVDSEAPQSRADVESAILEIAPESGQESIGRGEPTEWIAEFENVGRVRCTTFTDHRGPGLLLRMIATKAATAEQLGLAQEVQALATESQGLVLVAGPRASGKSTLLSALVDLVNRQRAEYVITLERQLRLVHDHKQALVSQREIRGGADESVAALRAALRESPDVLVVDDLLSPAMVPLLLTAASEGLLIFVSITAPSTADAVARFVELAPPEMRKAVQNAMAESFRGAVGQVLLKRVAGGLLAAREVMLASGPATRIISEGQFVQLPAALESGRKYGMVSFNDVLVDFVRAGTVDIREAFRKAHDREHLLEGLKRNGIDTSAVERLA
jgi:twitching motility protein PilT